MSEGLEYIREYYKVPAFVGAKVIYEGGGCPKNAVIKGSHNASLRVLFDDGQTGILHPTWSLTYEEVKRDE